MSSFENLNNLIQFRLTGTPDRTLLVSFYRLDTFDQAKVNFHIASLLVDNELGNNVLYEGNFQNNPTIYRDAIFNLLNRVEVYVNCVRIERLV